MNFILGIIFVGLGFSCIYYRYHLYRVTGDWEWAMKFLGVNGTILVIIMIGMALIFAGVAYPFGVFDSVNPLLVPVGLTR